MLMKVEEEKMDVEGGKRMDGCRRWKSKGMDGSASVKRWARVIFGAIDGVKGCGGSLRGTPVNRRCWKN